MRRTVPGLTNFRDGSGFSMLEAVVVVGVLLALAVGGFLSYGQITENAKIAKVKSTASEVYTAVMVNQIDGDPNTSSAEVIDRFNASSKKIRVDIRPGESDILIAAMPTDTYNPKSGDAFCVTASMIEEERIFAEMGDCSTPAEDNENSSEENQEPETPESQEPTVPPTQEPTTPPEQVLPPIPSLDHDPIMETTWNTSIATTCQQITLPVTKPEDNLMVDWGDGTGLKPFSTISPNYGNIGKVKIALNGKFEIWNGAGTAFTDSKCLTSVDRWGETGTTNLTSAFAESDSLENVEAIPSTTISLTAAFKNVDSDFTIGKLNTSNVAEMGSMFAGAKNFNKPVEFNTPKLTSVSNMFYNAKKFDSAVALNTSQVTSLFYMFHGASEFNQPLNFNTSKVVNFKNTFTSASKFDQDISGWDITGATDIREMFKDAVIFNKDLSSWKTPKITSAINRSEFDTNTPAWETRFKPTW
jgi:type II secretory pathway pseudopilin PulG